MVDIGKLDKRIVLQKTTETEDELGNTKVGWQDYKSVWATVKPYKSSEVNFMHKLKPEVTHRFYLRYRTGVYQDMRIKYRGHVFEIVGVLDMDEEHRLLEIQAKEVFEGERYSG